MIRYLLLLSLFTLALGKDDNHLPLSLAPDDAMVSVETWLMPSPAHAEGLLVRYGPQWLVESVAEYRGYDLSPYPDRCGLSLISPSDLGKIVWVRQADGTHYGPCLAVDVAARQHFAWIVYNNREVAEVPNHISTMMGFKNGQWGEIYIGVCPPPADSIPAYYQPPLVLDPDPQSITPSMWPYPEQQLPGEC